MTLIIKNNKLVNIPYVESPNHGGTIIPELIVCHYTAGSSMKGAVARFSNPANKVSANIVLERDGTMTQMVPFNIRAFHAGTSSWKGKDSVNGFSVGIEIVNFGKLIKKQNGCYSWSGTLIPPEQVYTAPNNTVWHSYPQKQLDVLWSLTEALVATYKTITDVVDHEQVAPKRKIDCGPAFPLKKLRKHLFGREEAL